MKKVTSYSVEDTVSLGIRIGKCLKGGEVLAMFGGMGMGKTAITHGILKGLGNYSLVSSPTFALVNDYGGDPAVYHFDMFRITSWDDLYSTGFFDYLDGNSILIVEWSENIDNALPSDAIKITFELGENENSRIITFDKDIFNDENSCD